MLSYHGLGPRPLPESAQTALASHEKGLPFFFSVSGNLLAQQQY